MSSHQPTSQIDPVQALRAVLASVLPALGVLLIAVAVAPWLGFLRAWVAQMGGFLLAVTVITVTAHRAVTFYGRSLRVTAVVCVVGVALGLASYALANRYETGVLAVVSALGATVAVLLFSSVLGVAVGQRIAEPGHLLAVALASSAADLWSVSSPSGVTHAVIVSKKLALVRMLAVSAPVPPDRLPEPMIGSGDSVFAALYLAALLHAGAPRWRATLAVSLGLVAAGIAAMLLRLALPALPFMGVFVVAMHPRTYRVPKHDRLTTAVVFVVFVAVLVVAVQRLSAR